jgi:hypothetical protein
MAQSGHAKGSTCRYDINLLATETVSANNVNGNSCHANRRRLGLCWFAVALAASVALATQTSWFSRREAGPVTLAELLRLPPTTLSNLSTCELNLLCATGLSTGKEPDIKESLATIDSWAQHVRSETERHLYRYERNPAEFDNSPGYFRMLMLAVVLAEDYGVHYDPQRIGGPETARMDDGFFADPHKVFLHGLLGPERVGTCSSLPVLYVAVGRQLGYPLKLVSTKGHLFVRWDGAGERFNVEATSRGSNRFDDDHYRHWPFEISPAEEQAEGYLKSLTPAGELSAFLSIRGMCLWEAGRLPEAVKSFEAAARLSPQCHGYQALLADLHATLARQMASTTLSSPNSIDQKSQN